MLEEILATAGQTDLSDLSAMHDLRVKFLAVLGVTVSNPEKEKKYATP